jgi:hypothetical protein
VLEDEQLTSAHLASRRRVVMFKHVL